MGSNSKRAILIIAGIVLVIAGVFAVRKMHTKPRDVTPASVVTPTVSPGPKREVIGKSVEGRDIEAYAYGTGTTTLVFAGGMHGGYEWNSVILAYQFMDYLEKTPATIPPNIKVIIIPSLNPDGVFAVIGKEGRFEIADVKKDKAASAPGRFNAHGVDLNRNFDCKWQPTSTWQNKTVSAGTSAFSEPETLALKNFILKEKPQAVVFWHSQSNAVYASKCKEGILPGTLAVMNAYAKAAGYPAVQSFDAYPISGDAEGWLASIHIPAITVELQTHETIEWDRNLLGVKALFSYFAQKT